MGYRPVGRNPRRLRKKIEKTPSSMIEGVFSAIQREIGQDIWLMYKFTKYPNFVPPIKIVLDL